MIGGLILCAPLYVLYSKSFVLCHYSALDLEGEKKTKIKLSTCKYNWRHELSKMWKTP